MHLVLAAALLAQSLSATAISATAPNERAYRITLQTSAGSAVALKADAPRGWVAAFCTARLCSVGRVVVHVPSSGRSVWDLHLYRVRPGAAAHGRVRVTAASAALDLGF